MNVLKNFLFKVPKNVEKNNFEYHFITNLLTQIKSVQEQNVR